jgi:hypothetical protein
MKKFVYAARSGVCERSELKEVHGGATAGQTSRVMDRTCRRGAAWWLYGYLQGVRCFALVPCSEVLVALLSSVSP